MTESLISEVCKISKENKIVVLKILYQSLKLEIQLK
jgi:hypothetical protein